MPVQFSYHRCNLKPVITFSGSLYSSVCRIFFIKDVSEITMVIVWLFSCREIIFNVTERFPREGGVDLRVVYGG